MFSRRFIVCVGLACCGAAVATSGAFAQIGRLGAVGDSLTDEYLDDTWTYAKNWTMQMVETRGLDMGPTAAAAGQPGGTWGEPRRTGYQYNWARYGADSATAITQGQPASLAAQVASEGLTHAVIEIGANDFNPSGSAYINIYFGFWSQTQINNYVSGRVANVESIVQTLEATGAGLLLCNYLDFGVTPAVRGTFTNANSRNRVSTAIAQVNQQVELIARKHYLVLVDLSKLGTAIIGTNTSLKQFLTIGNVNIQLFNKDTTTHTNPLAGFVDDGAHPHTTLHGVFANLMMAALNDRWQAGFTLFSDQEILDHGGIAYGGTDTLDAQIGPYSAYFRNFKCLGNFNGTGGTTVQDLFDFLTAWFAGDLRADINQSGTITTQDLFEFLAAWFAPCP